MTGKVYLVGAGPGDPKLITVKGVECLKESDVIIYDRLVNKQLLSYAKQDCELIFCGKFPKKHTMRQEQINELLVKKAKDGKIVTRLKGGDPCVFGRVGEEAVFLRKHGVPFEIVPGITAGIAAPAYAGIPVTHRDYGSTFTIVTGTTSHEEKQAEEKWKALATGVDTIAFYMGITNLPSICEKLIQFGRKKETPAAVIEWGTMPEQRTVTGTLETIAAKAERARISHPAIILVGNVVQLHDKISWFRKGFTNETENDERD